MIESSLLLVFVFALTVVTMSLAQVHISRIVMNKTYPTLSPTWISASIHGVHPLMQKYVITLAWTNNKISFGVIRWIAINMMHDSLWWKLPTNGGLGYEYVLHPSCSIDRDVHVPKLPYCTVAMFSPHTNGGVSVKTPKSVMAIAISITKSRALASVDQALIMCVLYFGHLISCIDRVARSSSEPLYE